MIRVIIERHCKPNKEIELRELLAELRRKTVQRAGYTSGETLRSVNDPSLWVVISTWTYPEMWQVWQNDKERQEIIRKIDTLLTAPAKETVLTFPE